MINKRLVNNKIIVKSNFKELLNSSKIVRICGACDALSAALVEEAGFEGIWLSSFEIHASYRLPDADILTISDYSQICNKISDRINIPILIDGDAGGGSPINTIRMVREYEKNGAAGICIEDNKYPKRCSFYTGVRRELESPKFHAAKIRAACDNRIDNNFFVVARTEALIVGLNIKEAIARANIYVDAGADAILVHYKGETPDKLFDFSKQFKKDVPLICVPTTYNKVTEKELLENGFKMVIYANYGIRAIVKMLQQMFKTINDAGTLSAANDEVVPMSEIFRLVGLNDLEMNEANYS